MWDERKRIAGGGRRWPGGAALAAASLIRPREARAAKAMTVVLESEVTILDPHVITATITRTFGLHVFDMLFAMNEKGEIKPQMVESYDSSPDKLTWTFALRDGLKWHDGSPVTAEDCVASLKRWSVRDPLGKMLMADTDSLEATDAKTFKLVLKQPFPLLLEVLGKPNAPLPVMMPARLAATPADQRIADPIGSGPFRFLKDQWRPGNAMVLERNPDYVPRKEAPDFLAGGKNVKIDQLTLRVMPDQSTGANALMAGEIDYMQYLPFDMLPILEKDKSVKLMGLGGIHQFQGNFRLNHAFPPFDNPEVRQVMWKLVDQDATLTAIGVPERYRAKSCPSFWMCGTPLTTDAGSSAAKVDLAAAKAELKASGYKGEPVIILEVAGSISQTASRVLVQNMRDVGFTVEQQPRDWPTVLARRAKKDGWSMFPVYSNGTDMYSPLTHFYVAATCNDFPGLVVRQPRAGADEGLHAAATLEERKKIAADIQVVCLRDGAVGDVGPVHHPGGLSDRPQGPDPVVLSDVLGGRPLSRPGTRAALGRCRSVSAMTLRGGSANARPHVDGRSACGGAWRVLGGDPYRRCLPTMPVQATASRRLAGISRSVGDREGRSGKRLHAGAAHDGIALGLPVVRHRAVHRALRALRAQRVRLSRRRAEELDHDGAPQRGGAPLRDGHRQRSCHRGLSRAGRPHDLHAHRGAAARRRQGLRLAPGRRGAG